MLSEYNLKLIYMEMEEPGFYYPKPRIVFLNEKLHEDSSEAFHLAHQDKCFSLVHTGQKSHQIKEKQRWQCLNFLG